ncbi:hypothetical protein JCM5350_003678 [Sporobolomyces pararoseus]
MQHLYEEPDEEWIDCKALFETALSELSTGQLVQDARYTMMDLMSAIEINDPRTDSYVAARNDQRERLPDFDPSRQLSAREAVWVVDEIMRLEATFQDGQPLMSTLWNCNYFRNPSLSALASSCNDERVGSIQSVFRAMLLGILKTQEIVWEECCKGQVYEHEDVHLASSTLSFNSLMAACYPSPSTASSPSPSPSPNPLLVSGQQATAPPPPADRAVSIDDVLRLLDECSTWLQSDATYDTEEERPAVEQLIGRLTLRIDLLYIKALFTFPAHTSPSQIRNHLDRISSYMSQLPTSSAASPSSKPSPHLRAIFAPSRSVPLLATSAPPRLVEPFPVGESYDKNVRELVPELTGLCQLWEGWRKEEGPGKMGWKEVKEYARMMARRDVSPYLRSLHQTLLTSTPSHVFSISPLVHFATSFLSTLTSIPASFLLEDVYTLYQTEHDYSSPAHVVFGWLERLAQEQVRTTLALAGQNRTRQFRWIRKSVTNWERLLEETKRDIVPILLSMLSQDEEVQRVRRGIENLEKALRSTFIELIVESIASGFEAEMELYRSDESGKVWFVLGETAGQLREIWQELLNAGGGNDGYLKSKMGEAKAIQELAKASFIMSVLLPLAGPKFSSPFLPSIVIDQQKADRGRYEQRFDWVTPSSGGGILKSPVSYEKYTEAIGHLKRLNFTDLVTIAKEKYEHVIDALTKTASTPLAERGAAVRPEFTLRNLASLRRTAFANLNKLTSLLNETSSSLPSQTPPTLKWDHAWFPTFI